MINRKLLAGGFLIAIGLSLGFGIGSLRAAGVPQTQPLFYSGSLTEAERPVTGTRDIAVSLWKHASSTTMTNRVCNIVANGTTVENGRFRIALDDCVEQVHAEPELWVELRVGGTAIGSRAKLGAVPYALEADRASNAAGALEARMAALEARADVKSARIGADGSVTATWISGVTHVTDSGAYQIAFAAGAFATGPACVATAYSGNSKSPAFECFNITTTGAECRANLHDPNPSALGIAIDTGFSILCVAPN